jgi:hypothetical protein
MNEGTAMSGWSDIALRARATTVVPSAVMYKAHTVLTRGRSTLEKGHLWIGAGINRYVEAPAYSAHAAHLASGWEQDQQKAKPMVLGRFDLPAYMGHKPHFWSISSSGWQNMPDSIGGEPAIAFWRDVCASMCFRWYDDDVEMMEVDLRPGLHEGDRSDTRPSKCSCYAYDDLAKLNSTGESTYEPEISHEAPNDLAMGRFLSTAKLVNNYVGTGTRPGDGFAIPDEGLRYRRFINTYAVHRDPWEDHFVIEEQSTVFYKLALEPGYHYLYRGRSWGSRPFGTPDSELYHAASNIANERECARECVRGEYESGTGTASNTRRMNFQTMVFIERVHPLTGVVLPAGTTNCFCSDWDMLLPQYDHLIVHDPSRLDIKVYRTKLCVGVAGGSERSVVYRKGVKGANAVCNGMPVGSGMILANGSMFLSRDAADDTRPIDVQCKSACDANPDCGLAHSFVSARTA